MTEEADRLCAELETTAEEYVSPCFQAWALQARAGALIAQDQGKEALILLRSALHIYRELHDQYETAKVYELMAEACLGEEEPGLADAHAASALGLYRQLGAEPDVARLAADSGPAGLTPRELEVLSCVAEGASNKAIAGALFISQKTVGRHIANIFVKLDVPSRTAAAAWFHEHGLAHARVRR